MCIAWYGFVLVSARVRGPCLRGWLIERIVVVGAELDSGRVRNSRDVEDSAALLGFVGALRTEAPLVLQRHPGVRPRLPHVWLADLKGVLRHRHTPLRTALREGGPLSEGERRAARVRSLKAEGGGTADI